MSMLINTLEISPNEMIVCDYYLACNTKIASYRLLRKLNGELHSISDDGAKKGATKFFQKDYIIKYLEMKEKDLIVKYQTEKIVGDIANNDNDDKSIDLATAPKDDVNKVLISKLEEVLQDPNSTAADIISATNKISDIRNSKEKSDETAMTDYEKTVHFCLPADICEDCPNKEKIYAEQGYPATEEEIKETFYKNINRKKDDVDKKEK
mgnify:FL=1